jgi:peptidoglycan/xylan/chitin deacetylase (PgdA/CDA1 family)
MKAGRLVRQLAAQLAFHSGMAARRLRRRLVRGPVVLAYHRIIDDTDPCADCTYPQLHIPPAHFVKHVELIAALGPVLSLADLLSAGEPPAPLPGGFLITFDDGWRDNVTNALPLLRQAGVGATIFGTTGFIGTGNLPWTLRAWMLLKDDAAAIQRLEQKHLGNDTATFTGEARLHRLFELVSAAAYRVRESFVAEVTVLHTALTGADRPEVALSWEDCRTALGQGVTFGGHTHTHGPLTLMPADERSIELRRSRTELQQQLDHPIHAMSYPHSACTTQIIEEVHQAGYSLSFGNTPVPAAPAGSRHRILPRIEIDRRTTVGVDGCFSRAMMLCRLGGIDLWR